jgi:hypothetical protein
MARTERAEGTAETLSGQLAEAKQRLIHSDEEVRELQTAFREQAQLLAAERERLLEARSRTESDAEAYIAAQETEITLRESRITSLESQIGNLQGLLNNAQRTDIEDALRQEIATLKDRYDNDVAAMQREQNRVSQSQAASDVQMAAREARISMLEARIGNLQNRLRDAQKADVEDAMRQELNALQTRYENDVQALRMDRDRLGRSNAASEEQLTALFAESTQRLSDKDNELRAREREIATLTAESTQLRARVQKLQSGQTQQAQASGYLASQLQAQLSETRQQVISLTMALDQEKAKKSAMEARLLQDRIKLQHQLEWYSEASAQEIQLLRAEITAAESTINVQTLRIATLEKETQDSGVMLAELKTDFVEPEPVLAETGSAMTVLEMARSRQEPYLGRYHALLIANQDYRNMEDLSTPIRDAMEIEKLLINRYGFSVKVLRNATDDEIMRTLHDYSNTLTEEDNLLIYYAGRGSTPDGPPDRAYWLGVDADPQLRNTWLLAEHVSDKIKEIEAKRVLLVTDSCFSRRRVQSVTMAVGHGLDPEKFKLLAQFKSRYVLTSGANLPVYDESGDRSHSLFAKYFMEVLRQNKNVMSGEMLSHEMIIRVRERVVNPDRATPTYNFLQDAGHRAGDFFFVPMQNPLLVSTSLTMQDSV